MESAGACTIFGTWSMRGSSKERENSAELENKDMHGTMVTSVGRTSVVLLSLNRKKVTKQIYLYENVPDYLLRGL